MFFCPCLQFFFIINKNPPILHRRIVCFIKTTRNYNFLLSFDRHISKIIPGWHTKPSWELIYAINCPSSIWTSNIQFPFYLLYYISFPSVISAFVKYGIHIQQSLPNLYVNLLILSYCPCHNAQAFFSFAFTTQHLLALASYNFFNVIP